MDTTGNIGTIYMLLLDSNNSVIDQVLAVDQGNGVFDFNFTNVAAGSYRIIAGSDIDNDLFICQLAEACGGYPTIDTLSTFEAVNSDITGLDFIIDIMATICDVTNVDYPKTFKGNTITSIVTARAVEQLKLAPGIEIMALIKTNEVMLAQ